MQNSTQVDIELLKMCEDLKLQLFELGNINDNILDDKPWARDLIINLQRVTKKATMRWLKFVFDIDPSEHGNKHYVEEFSKKIIDFYEKIIFDMEQLYETYTDGVQKLVNRLEYLEKELGVEKSAICKQEKNVPLKELELKLKSQVSHYEYVLQIRQEETSELNAKYAKFSKRLGIDPKYLPENAKMGHRESFVKELRILENEITKREEKVLSLKRDIREISEETGVLLGESFFQKLANNPLKITENDMNNFEEFHREVVDYKNMLCTQIKSLKSDIEKLWNVLEIPTEERDTFLDDIETMNLKRACSTLSMELERLKDITTENSKKAIAKQRTELNQIWDLCYIAPSTRNKFSDVIDAKSDEALLDVLNSYNEEIEKWKLYYNQNKEIFDTLKNYLELKSSQSELEQNTNSKNVYKNRGGSLAVELRKRKMLISKIQTAETKLLQLSKQYLEINGKPLLIFDQTLEVYIGNKKKEQANEILFTVQKNKNPSYFSSPKSSTCHGRNKQINKNIKVTNSVDTRAVKRIKLVKEQAATPDKHIKKICKNTPNEETFIFDKEFNNGSESCCLQDYNEFKKDIKVRSSSFCHEEANKISKSPL